MYTYSIMNEWKENYRGYNTSGHFLNLRCLTRISDKFSNGYKFDRAYFISFVELVFLV